MCAYTSDLATFSILISNHCATMRALSAEVSRGALRRVALSWGELR